MSLYPLELEANIIQFVVIVVMTIWFAIKNRDRFVLTRSLFFWGMLAHILLNAYWLSMILVDGAGNYVTFTASDTATVATFLLWSTMYHLENKTDVHSEYAKKKLPVSQVLFCICNVVWWMLWSKNYVINLIWGITFALFSYMIFYNLEMKGTFTKTIASIWYVAVAAVFVFQIPVYIFEKTNIFHVIGDYACAITWIVFIVMFLVMAHKDKHNKTTWLFASMLYSLYAQYMSDGIVYSVFVIIETLLLFSVIRVFDLPKSEEAAI